MLYIPDEINRTLIMWDIRDEFEASLERARYRFDYERVRAMRKIEDEHFKRMYQLVSQHDHAQPERAEG